MRETIYKKMYTTLFNAVTNALERMEDEDFLAAQELLRRAQQAGDENFFRRPCMGTGKKPGGEGVTGGHPPKGAPSGRWKTVFRGPKSGCPRLGPLPREGGLSAVLQEIFRFWELLPSCLPPPERRETGRKSYPHPGLDKERFGAIIFSIQLALTEKNPRSGEQRGTHSVEGSRDTRRPYHS